MWHHYQSLHLIESTTSNPDRAANNINSYILDYKAEIVQSDTPSENFKIGYFEGFDVISSEQAGRRVDAFALM